MFLFLAERDTLTLARTQLRQNAVDDLTRDNI